MASAAVVNMVLSPNSAKKNIPAMVQKPNRLSAALGNIPSGVVKERPKPEADERQPGNKAHQRG